MLTRRALLELATVGAAAAAVPPANPPFTLPKLPYAYGSFGRVNGGLAGGTAAAAAPTVASSNSALRVSMGYLLSESITTPGEAGPRPAKGRLKPANDRLRAHAFPDQPRRAALG